MFLKIKKRKDRVANKAATENHIFHYLEFYLTTKACRHVCIQSHTVLSAKRVYI
jgi:hypothetical protein